MANEFMAAAKKNAACECLKFVDEKLAGQGLHVDVAFFLDGRPCRAIVSTSLVVPACRQTHRLSFAATFCPFCGKKYPDAKPKLKPKKRNHA